MTERYGRQTYKNLLTGMGGGALIGYQPQQQTLGGNSDENAAHPNLVNAKNIQLKTAANIIASASSTTHTTSTTTTTMLSNTTSLTSSHTTTSTSNNTNSASTGNMVTALQQANGLMNGQQQLSLQNLANMRNALGDIGNRLTSSQQAAAAALINKKDTIVTNVVVKPTAAINDVVLINPAPPPPVSSNNNNNSCIMLDESEVEQIVEEEEEEDVELEIEESIIDIDEFDSDNTQLVSEYVKDIYKYLSQVEKNYRISPAFLEGKIVTTKMRSVLIDWLIQVHLKFHLLQETLYLCVQIIDAYLMAVDVPKMQLQLVGVTAMFVASKYEEMYVPAIDDFVYMTDNTYTKSEIRQMEISILKTLQFMFCKPLPLHFLRRFSKAGSADPKQHTLAKYFMELSLHDAEFSSLDPSYLAACSLCLAFKLLIGTGWNKTLEHYSKYKPSSLLPGMQKIAKLVIKSSEPDYKYRAVTNKYGASKLLRISLQPELSSNMIKELANGGGSVSSR